MTEQPMPEQRTETPAKLPKDPFAYIAFWQLMTFFMLLAIIWVNEVSDLTGVFFKTTVVRPDIFRGCVLSAAVFISAIVIIGNTYTQQKRVLGGLISVCAKCHKVRIDEHRWKNMEEYISDNSLLSFTHGFCPECMDVELQYIHQRNAIRRHESEKKDVGKG